MHALSTLFVAALLVQQPQIQNGAVETRPTSGLDRDIARIAATATAPTWVGWRETASEGTGSACCWYTDDTQTSRGCTVEPSVPNTRGFAGMNVPDPRPTSPAPTGPARLEAGTDVLVLVRLVDGHVERIRTYSDDCPLDAGGRQVIWLEGVPAADSVKYLSSLIALTDVSGTPTDLRRRINSAAITAIGHHRDGSVDSLIALAKQSSDSSSRSSAFTWLGRSRDPKAVAFIEGILKKSW
jgi:hypothetical protein